MGKSLIIVESPAKARTLQKYLGKNYAVKASVGHVRDLPVKDLGVDVEHDFTPKYVTIKGKGKVLTELKNAAKQAEEIYLAPDPDREGEAIAWHIAQALKAARKPVHRVLFHELTKKAILAALKNATEVNRQRFEAQQARRILDRLVGYQLSPLLWEKVRRGLSAGRVQSVAVRMVCEREQEIERFTPEEYWSITARLEGPKPPPFEAKVERIRGKKLDNRKEKIADQQQAEAITAALRQATFTVSKVEKKRKKRFPSPPFITSTLQMEANRKLRFSAKKTMGLAQRLYEGVELGSEGPVGLITYMRTDSTRINDEALAAARDYIQQAFGADYLPAKPVVYKTSKSAQDAHEAIRPTEVSRTPDEVAPFLDKDLLALYTLVWKRFVACQMAPAQYDQTSIQIEADGYGLKATGSILRFLGFMTLYVESTGDDSATSSEPAEAQGPPALPDLAQGDTLRLLELLPKQHFTQPPPRYSEATLVKALEENGVGRPSTYATILSTIQEKGYVELLERRFRPTDLGRLVTELLVAHFPEIMDVEFTASLEEQLDRIESGQVDWVQVLRNFYSPFQTTLAKARQEMVSVKGQGIPTDLSCPRCGGTLVIKWGRNGQFLACQNFPECKHTQDFRREPDGSIVPLQRPEEEDSGEVCEKCGKPMVYRHGRFGKFLACSGYPECRNVRAISTGVACPEEGCDGELVQKVSRRGKIFYSCNRYPACTFAVWDKPVNTPCPVCGSPFLLEKETKKHGLQLRCPNKQCRFRQKKESS